MAITVISTFAFVLVFNSLIYPSWRPLNDPKNPKYLLWKRGFYNLDPDIAVQTMIGDPRRESIIIGQSKTQLEKRFGYVTPIDKAAPYYQGAWRSRSNRASEVFEIRNSDWLVVFSSGKAADLILVKGF
jgi:hypothetical protein